MHYELFAETWSLRWKWLEYFFSPKSYSFLSSNISGKWYKIQSCDLFLSFKFIAILRYCSFHPSSLA